ncbi:KH domain-containing protein [Candidatus Gracilibacteria bacterium]|nr:KH domain-containing protein [Candidatus Gracilibacteria bacterium]
MDFSYIQAFFEKMQITIDSLDIKYDDEGVHINLQTPDSALLIGMHGRGFQSLRHLLSRMVEVQSGSFQHIYLEINDYMKQKDQKLFRFIDSKIVQIRSNGKEVIFPNFNAFERKKAHNYIAELGIEGLETHSEGERKERKLHMTYTGSLEQTPKRVVVKHHDLSELSEDGVGI